MIPDFLRFAILPIFHSHCVNFTPSGLGLKEGLGVVPIHCTDFIPALHGFHRHPTVIYSLFR